MTSASRIFWQQGNLLTKISDSEFPLTRCLENFVFDKKSSITSKFLWKNAERI